MGVSGWMGDGKTSSQGATKQPQHISFPSYCQCDSLAGWNEEFALSLLSGIRVLVEPSMHWMDWTTSPPCQHHTSCLSKRRGIGWVCESSSAGSRPQRILAACPADPAPTAPLRGLAAEALLVQLDCAWKGTFTELYWSTTRKVAFRCRKDLIALGILSNRLKT